MNIYINLDKSEHRSLHFISDVKFQKEFKKGWGFPFVYHFKEIRDIFIALREVGFGSLKEFTRKCTENLEIDYERTPWDTRRVLEHVNALVNFGLINKADKSVKKDDFFKDSKIGEPISYNDLEDFKRIYFSYFRFKEIMAWFIAPDKTFQKEFILEINENHIKSESKIAYTFIRKSRFNDSFIFELKDHTPVYIIPSSQNEKNEHLMRFWDVFIKWGTKLSLLEKFSMKSLNYKLSTENKSFSCVYFKKELHDDFDIVEYIKNNYKSNYISIQGLIFKIIQSHRFSIFDIKKAIVKAERKHSNELSLQRTSEIFVGDTKIFLPKVDDTYVSHILLY